MQAKTTAPHKKNTLNKQLIEFLQNSPTPYHAVKQMCLLLKKNGFKRLDEGENWDIKKGGRFYITRNDSSLVAIDLGKKPNWQQGLRLVGAHTDSPCLKIKPNAEYENHSFLQTGVEVYGGVLLSTWFDRDLSLAGKIVYTDQKNKIHKVLVDLKDPIAFLPNLAIHLNRDANEKRSIQKQKELPPLLASVGLDKKKLSLNKFLIDHLKNKHRLTNVKEILSSDLFYYDTQPPQMTGIEQDFLCSARLDNLLSCFVGTQAFLDKKEGCVSVLVCNDHEEVGSASAVGAEGPFLKDVLERMLPKDISWAQIMSQSMLVSVDNAHGVHPNFPEKHDSLHGPYLNHGPVLKINANQRYATDSETAAIFTHLAKQLKLPIQKFVNRTDLGCGSTIGPITSKVLGVKTLDLGVPTFGMHSIREMAGGRDSTYLYQLLKQFYQLKSVTLPSAIN